jgi:hypothetical protein
MGISHDASLEGCYMAVGQISVKKNGNLCTIFGACVVLTNCCFYKKQLLY